jgi:TPR repeat protein
MSKFLDPPIDDDVHHPEALFLQAEKHEERGDFKSAFKLLLRAAQLGHTGSQINVGIFLLMGKRCKEEQSKCRILV